MLTDRIPVIVVDDETPSRVALSTYINDFCPGLEIVSECDSVKTAYQAIIQLKPKLVFLDIEMPNGNGFDLLQLFKSPPFKVVFVTAYSEYAIRAFRFAAVDYLLKPVKIDELVEAVERVKDEFEKEIDNDHLKILRESFSSHNGEHRQFVIHDLKGYTIVKTADLIMCEADGYCTQLYLSGKRKVTSTKNLGYFEDILGDKQMIKVHRSYLINPDKVIGFNKHGEIHLEENCTCPLGSIYKKSFLQKIGY